MRWVSAAILFLLSAPVTAAMWTITYPRPLSEADMRDEYPRALLTLALEKTGVKYTLLPSERILLQGKALRQLRENREVNVVWSMTDSQREKDLLPIRIPIAKGLIGLRVFLINQQKRSAFAAVSSQQDLISLAPIQGEEWPDTKILQANGFNVLTVPDYPEAFSMLNQNRGDFFPRSVIEVINELEEADRNPDIMLEPDLAIYYPTAMYFFVNRGDTTLARLIETGLRRALEDGSFDALFMSTHEEMLNRLNIPQRKIFKMDNPLLPENTPLNNPELWIDLEELQN
ncbi:amino acid ABC transporter substrate-binding protein [Alteromonas sp. H39]|uniref:amino acid ABC transporter substrate-binding protein n=1 Tax=Alteromonas sp. H39 TaxID=3389876 RepID=UPI0039DF6C7E